MVRPHLGQHSFVSRVAKTLPCQGKDHQSNSGTKRRERKLKNESVSDSDRCMVLRSVLVTESVSIDLSRTESLATVVYALL